MIKGNNSLVNVSVVIPAFNAEKWIVACINSVLNQTCLPSEIIIVNDGSTDRTIDILKEQYSLVHSLKIVHQFNKGLAGARNRGIIESTNPFIAFLDADDVWLPEKIGRQLELLEAAGGAYGLCYTFAEKIDEYGKIKSTWREINLLDNYFKAYTEITPEVLAHGNYVVGSGSSVLMRRECINKVGLFNDKFELAEDWEYWYRLSLKYKVLTIPEVLVQIRFHGSSMHSSHNKRLRRQLNTIQSMMKICPQEHYNILRETELKTVATIVLRNISDKSCIMEILREYGLSIIPASFKKIASWTKHNLSLFVYKVKAFCLGSIENTQNKRNCLNDTDYKKSD